MRYMFLTLAAASFHTQIVKAVAVRSPIARGDDTQCAQVGYDTVTQSYWASTDGNYPGCSALCFSQPECKSFGFGPGECQLYNVPIYPNIAFEGDSPYFFYDTACEKEFVNCAKPGYDYQFGSYQYTNNGAYADCVKSCTSQKSCKSYAYGNGECFLYNVPLSGNLNPKASSPYLFYDVKCAKTTNSTVTSSKGSTSSTTPSPSSSSSSTTSSTKISSTINTNAITTSTSGNLTSTSMPPYANTTIITNTKQTTPTTTNQQTISTITTINTSQATSTISSSTSTSSSVMTTALTTVPSGTISKTTANAATVTTTVTISNQPYFCTAMNGSSAQGSSSTTVSN